MIENVIKGKVSDLAGEDVAQSSQVNKAAEKIADAVTSKTGGNVDLPKDAEKGASGTGDSASGGGGLASQIQGFMGTGEVKTDASKKDGGLAGKLGGFLNK